MGLCKCPKKKVTNLFCFEHRVNVCEHCLVANHTKCIVQSYLQWLQDSDYDPSCRLCGKNLSEETSGQCVRLACYDIFHWQCLDDYAKRLPANTAPAGYTCPICKGGVFPPGNMKSPVTDTLKQLLSTVNWARTGLGLPLIEEAPASSTSNQQLPPDTYTSQSSHIPMVTAATSPIVHGNTPPSGAGQAGGDKNAPSHSVISMDDPTLYARSADQKGNSEQIQDHRKVFDSRGDDGSLLNLTHDHDEDKYKRRPALQWFARWFSSRPGPQKNDPNASMKRCAVILILLIIGFLTFLMIMTRVGRSSADNDPFLDPLANPNIRVED